MSAVAPPRTLGAAAPVGALAALAAAGVILAATAVVIAPAPEDSACTAPAAGLGAAAVALAPAGGGRLVGATEYGGPGDPSSGRIGASGIDLQTHPDSYAELGGDTFQTADAMGGLPYLTPLRITWGGHSLVAYKRDFGFGGGPVAGLPRVIDLWWQLAGRLGVPYASGMWSGAVRVARLPAGGATALLGQGASAPVASPAAAAPVGRPLGAAVPAADAAAGQPTGAGCGGSVAAAGASAVLPLTAGERAQLLPDGSAAAPAAAPPAVRGMIAAGNAIAGRPYVYGAGHGLPLDEVGPAYDCSSSVEHLLYGGRLLPVGYAAASGTLESFGVPGPGRWVTIYASAAHVFMYVAGLRWDTWNAAGPQDGSSGIGWHPLVRSAAGFVARHPVGL